MSSRPRQFLITDIVPEEEARRISAEKKETEARRKSEEEKEQRRIDEIKLLNNKIIEYQIRINQMERTAVSKITAAIKRFKVQKEKETKSMRKYEEEKEQRTAVSKITAAIKMFNVQKKARRKFEEEKEQRRIDEIKLLNNKIIEYQIRINQLERIAASKITAAIKRFNVQKKARRNSEEEQINKDFWDDLEKKLNRVTI